MTDENYQFSVFLECQQLDEEQLKKLLTYFRVRRRSGGGDCGSIRRIDNLYCVSFRQLTDQQAVLQRRQHVVGGLVFTVRGNLEPHTSCQSQDVTAPVQRSIPASTAPPGGEDYELRPDSFLLRYLEESPQVWRELEERLSCFCCSAQLRPEDGKVVVRSHVAPPAAAEEVRDWRAEVDKLLDGYRTHYEVDPYRRKALLQSCSSAQTSDEVKVYSEGGMVVVVGEHSQVNARLMDVEDCHVKRGVRVREKQTSVRRLGEAKLRLLWKEMELSLRRDFPGLVLKHGAAGQLVLEGSPEDILKAGAWISDQEKLVFERAVPDISPHLLSFLRKVYGVPEVLGVFLGVGGKVEIELGDTELRLLSLSTDHLHEAEKVLKGEMKEVKLDIPNCSTVPSELQEKLKSKTTEMNRGQFRTQVVFGPDSTVFLLGHTKEVEELNEAVIQFVLDQSIVQSIIHLRFAQELPEWLQLHGFDHSGVTFHPSTSASGTTLVLEGPSSIVTEVRNRLDPFLGVFLQDRVTIGPPEEVRHSQNPTGKDDLLDVAHDLAPLSLSNMNTPVGSYSLCDGLQVLVCQGDITRQDADALVNAANEDLEHNGGVAAALSRAGGPQVQRESRALIKQTGVVPTGEVVVTTGGNLCKRLLHAVGPVGGQSGGKEKILLEKTVLSALDLAEMMEFRSIALPCISAGSFGVPVSVCSDAIVTAVKEFGSQGGRNLRSIILIDNREEVVRAMQEACDRLLRRTRAPSDLDFQRGFSSGAPEGRVHVEIVQGSIQTQQVDALVSPMVASDPLSTRVGNTLFKVVGRQLTAEFRRQPGGDIVLVDGLSQHPFHSVFFLNLLPWDDDPEAAVQVLSVAVNNLLTFCEIRGFRSVALPVLGAGIALGFPDSVVAKVLMEQVHEFEQNRTGRNSFLIRIVIHPDDEKAAEAFKAVLRDFQLTGFVNQPDQVSTTRRIVLLGKTGSGKSNLANTIFGEELFATNHTPNSGTKTCQAETRSVNGRSLTLIDTPGFFDAGGSKEELKPEIVRCITECSPGPHAFLILLKVEKFTEHEQAVITEICQHFSEEALKYAVIVFTHGDQLPRGTTIEEFVGQNENLRDLVKKCGGRCHVMDNKYWKNNQQNSYRSNRLQVEELLNTVDHMVMENNGGYYTNKVLQEVEKVIKMEEELIKQTLSSGNMSPEDIREEAKSRVSQEFLKQLAGTATGVLLGAVLGMAVMVGLVLTAVRNCSGLMGLLKRGAAAGGGAAAAGGGAAAAGGGAAAAGGGAAAAGGGAAAVVALGVSAATFATAGGVVGGVIGHEAAKEAETPWEAATMAANAVTNKGRDFLKQL